MYRNITKEIRYDHSDFKMTEEEKEYLSKTVDVIDKLIKESNLQNEEK